jgi:hypothetical protein
MEKLLLDCCYSNGKLYNSSPTTRIAVTNVQKLILSGAMLAGGLWIAVTEVMLKSASIFDLQSEEALWPSPAATSCGRIS